MITVTTVQTHRQRKAFINFPLKLYKGNKYFVPCFYGDEMNVLKRKSPYEDVTESEFFLAYDGKKVVGRIQAIIQKQYNEKWNEKRVRFTRFDAIDDVNVSRALFDAVEKWAKERGMDTICGPLGYSDLEREGLLIEGFDEVQTFEEQYNYSYYQKLIEDKGFVKEVDWVESAIKLPNPVDKRIEFIAQHILKKNNLTLVDTSKSSKKEFLKKYGDGFFDCITEAYSDLYGYVPFTEKTRKEVMKAFYPIIDLKEVFFIVDSMDKVVALALIFPGVGKAVRKSNGHLYPLSIYRLVRLIKNPETIDLGLIAVGKEYRNSGVTAVFVSEVAKLCSTYKKFDHFETNLNLENNIAIRNMWNRFESREHKRRRSFVKKF